MAIRTWYLSGGGKIQAKQVYSAFTFSDTRINISPLQLSEATLCGTKQRANFALKTPEDFHLIGRHSAAEVFSKFQLNLRTEQRPPGPDIGVLRSLNPFHVHAFA